EAVTVRGELGIGRAVSARSDFYSSCGVEAVIPELSVGVEEEVLGIGCPVIGRDRVPLHCFLLALVLDRAGSRRERVQLFARHQHRWLAGGQVNVIERPVVAAIVALNVGDLRAVGAPVDALGNAPGNAAVSKDSLDGELLSGLGRRRSGLLGLRANRRGQCKETN